LPSDASFNPFLTLSKASLFRKSQASEAGISTTGCNRTSPLSFLRSLLYLFTEKEGEPIEEKVRIPSKKKDEKLTIDDQEKRIYELLLEKYNIVLYGLPGTGKTREAFQLAKLWRFKFGQDTVYQKRSGVRSCKHASTIASH
jgi:hypothetical protein